MNLKPSQETKQEDVDEAKREEVIDPKTHAQGSHPKTNTEDNFSQTSQNFQKKDDNHPRTSSTEEMRKYTCIGEPNGLSDIDQNIIESQIRARSQAISDGDDNHAKGICEFLFNKFRVVIDDVNLQWSTPKENEVNHNNFDNSSPVDDSNDKVDNDSYKTKSVENEDTDDRNNEKDNSFTETDTSSAIPVANKGETSKRKEENRNYNTRSRLKETERSFEELLKNPCPRSRKRPSNKSELGINEGDDRKEASAKPTKRKKMVLTQR